MIMMGSSICQIWVKMIDLTFSSIVYCISKTHEISSIVSIDYTLYTCICVLKESLGTEHGKLFKLICVLHFHYQCFELTNEMLHNQLCID